MRTKSGPQQGAQLRLILAKGEIGRKMTILPSLNARFSNAPVRLVQSRLKRGEDANAIGESRAQLVAFLPQLRAQLARYASECERCVRVEWLELWCNTTDEFCRAVDTRNQMLLFVDCHHVSLLGALHAADFLYRAYEARIAASGGVLKNKTINDL